MSLVSRNVAAIKVAGARGMATEKQILMRINATSNIAKITKSMKMVSAAKMRGAERRMNDGRPFATWLENTNSKLRIYEKDGYVPAEELKEGHNTFVPITSDRGLCGGCNSYIAKAMRLQINDVTENSSIFTIGDKGRGQLRRTHGKYIIGNATETWINPTNFAKASALAEVVLSMTPADEKLHVIFNKFQSAILYQQSIRTINTDPETYADYELEPDNKEEVLLDLKEFQLATAIFHGMLESNTSEESSRMTAMENASSNASDLISSLRLVYNKARQSRITTELIEIISGAASLDAKQ
ncbi:ATP synthase F1 [Saprolegnia parasitica CBS 223.65]|uniref:ATP synthase subunit gamma n=1 Tax=Saprolegnia parasitica (strain CBS 223.65) TaxID=695850 RepID=A0A067BLY8_SAPPC|nr:ATP synthase F1 [Saprolegnia parasitica CBS 223.65]KDO19514.1 ATP synthase F1 [Saprolegnia parasitica CBS 223.65]|eukprot:XP_012209778.1 ATP synthase F1 [Saprolegnia parasitica CBS 223.65]